MKSSFYAEAIELRNDFFTCKAGDETECRCIHAQVVKNDRYVDTLAATKYVFLSCTINGARLEVI